VTPKPRQATDIDITEARVVIGVGRGFEREEDLSHARQLADLADLSRCAWESLKVFLQEAVPQKNPIPGAVIAVQTFGD